MVARFIGVPPEASRLRKSSEQIMKGVVMDSTPEEKKSAVANPREALIAILDEARKSLSNGSGGADGNGEPAERIYNVREAGEFLRYKSSYIYELVKRGDLAAIRHGKYITIREGAIRDFISRNERRGE